MEITTDEIMKGMLDDQKRRLQESRDKMRAKIGAVNSSKSQKPSAKSSNLLTRSNDFEGITVKGTPLQPYRRDFESGVGIRGSKETSRQVPGELAGVLRAPAPIAPEKSVLDLCIDSKGWYRVVKGQKVYEK